MALHAVAHRGAQPRHQLADTERLVDEIVRADIERLDFLAFAVARGQHDDRHIGPLSDGADDVLAVTIRKPEIEHDDVGNFRGDALGSVVDRPRRRDLVIIGGERGPEEAQDRRLVVHNQDASLDSHVDSIRGNVSTIRVPRPFAAGLSAAIEPSCASMMPLAIARPSPVPWPPSAVGDPGRAARTNFSNT